tara:strand:- start:1839 stop:2522 length:684 start_codon:yes stop_codon:yes gene_type:complete
MRYFIFSGFCFVFGISLSQQFDSYSDSASNAQELYKMKDYDNALKSYERAKKLQNGLKMSAAERAKLDIELGQTAYRSKDFAKALAYFKNAAQAESNNMKRAELLRNLGNTSMQLQNIDQAIAFYKQGIKLHQEDVELKYNLSQALRKKSQSNNSKSQKNQKDNTEENKPTQSKPNEKNKSDNQDKAYSFKEEQKRKILNDLLRKEAETKRRIEKQQSTPSTNGKDW